MVIDTKIQSKIIKFPCGKTRRLYWLACPRCGKERWVQRGKGNPLCRLCNARKIGGHNKIIDYNEYRRKNEQGYIMIRIPPNNFFYSMTNKSGYILEHRLVVAKSLGRCLNIWEIVHHKNGIKDDNRLENLKLVLMGMHKSDIMCPFCHKTFSIR